MALSPIHNQWLTKLATNENGEVVFFLPAFGYVILFLGTAMLLLNNWEQVRAKGWGDSKVTVPLVIIAIVVALSGLSADGLEAKFAPLGMVLFMLALYVAARVLGKGVFLPLATGSAIASAGIIAHQFTFPGQATGGFVFERNYDVATGYILLGAALFIHRWQWLLASLSLVALFLSGSAEAVFAIGMVGLAILLRRDWSKKLAISLSCVCLVAVPFFVLGYGQNTHRLTEWAVTGNTQYLPADRNPNRGTAWDRRWSTVVQEMSEIQPLGKGYNLTDFSAMDMVHNTPLVIVQQTGYPGIVAALAWLWVSLYCLVKTRWKYAWILILSLSVFDHYIWTQLAPYWWAVVGASLASNIRTDKIFSKDESKAVATQAV